MERFVIAAVYPDSIAETAMPTNNHRKLFHATMHVTRTEEWFIEASSPEEAQRLLESGQGERGHIGECVQIEFGQLSE